MISTAVTEHAGTLSLSVAATVGLIAFLVIGNTLDGTDNDFLRTLARSLLVFSMPLLVVFSLILVSAVFDFAT